MLEGRLTIRAAEGEFFMEATGVEDLDSNCFGDPVYSAEASALRRAMAKFGYGLDLWRKGSSRMQDKSTPPSQPNHPMPSGYSVNNRKISQPQINRLLAIAKSAGVDRADIDAILKGFRIASPKDILMTDYDRVVKAIEQWKPKPVYSSWKNENDALEWAMSELPKMHMNRLSQEWEHLKPIDVDGKPSKAVAWVKRVEELKALPF